MTHSLELQSTHADLMRLHPGPWYLDRCNATGVEVRDVRGDVVYVDDFEFGPEHGPSFIETVTSRSVALARYLVAMSDAANREDSTPKVVLIAVFGISLLANFAGKSTVTA